MKKTLLGKRLSKGMLMTALICGAISFTNASVYANDIQEFSLDEYVVTAARTETKLVDTPANITVVGAEEIESRHYQDVSEVLKDIPGVNIIDTGVGANPKALYLNGDSRVLVLVDGRRVNIDMGATSGKSTFDLNLMPNVASIERIEVLKGAGGALYGSEAVGGVINIITKKADSDFGKASLGFGSHGYRDMNAFYSVREGKTGVVVSVGKDKQDFYEYKDALSGKKNKWPGKSNYENDKVSLKVEQMLTTNSNLTVGYDYSKFEGTDPSDITGWYAAGLDKRTDQLYAKYDWKLNDRDLGYIQVFNNKLEYNNYSVGFEGYYEEEVKGFDLQQTLSVSDNNKFVVGASYRKSELDVTGASVFKGDIDNKALFISNTWEIIPSWTLNTGIRYDEHNVAGDETTFSAALNKKLDENSHIYLNWGQVFNAPTMSELYHPWGGNDNIKPETGETWTIGYGTKTSDSTYLGISYFESELENAIRYDITDYTTMSGQYENVDKQKKQGMEFIANHKLNDKIDLEASYTYVKVEDFYRYNGYYTRDLNAIPNTYRAGVRYNDDKINASIFLRAGSGASCEKYVDSNYIAVDCALTYKATKTLSLYAKAYNIFNEAYAEHGGLYNNTHMYPAQSRRFIVGAEYKF